MTIRIGLMIAWGITGLIWSLGCRLLLRHRRLLLRVEALERKVAGSGAGCQPVGKARATNAHSPPGERYAEYHRMQDDVIRSAVVFPIEQFSGGGIVIVAGGIRYFTCAWVCITLLRRVLGCTLPIQVWYRGPEEMSQDMITLLQPFGVECIDLYEVQRRYPARRLGSYECKPYAILHSPFKEVILLDADNLPLIDPVELLSHPEYRRTGAIFWPDVYTLSRDCPIWEICRVPYRLEPEFESGQIVVDKERCWAALQLTMHMNEWSDFYYQYVRGDKDTFHVAWRMLQLPYGMTSHQPRRILGRFSDGDQYMNTVLEQHDFDGRVIFQHRHGGVKWNAWGQPFKPMGPQPSSAQYDEVCREALDELRQCWSGRVAPPPEPSGRPATEAEVIRTRRFLYCRVGADQRILEFLPDHQLQEGRTERPRLWWEGKPEHERTWWLEDNESERSLIIQGKFGVTCKLNLGADGIWRGRWLHYEQMPIELIPLAPTD